ncbi:MAG: response regulator [Deltaproteobacteria bacterium]|nr:response regulator [Deltaproteobacteria bacterium]
MAKKALVVDNDFFFVEFLSELLEGKGFRVIKAYDGKEGVSKLDEESIDILFVDMIMPKIDGRQLIGIARSKFPGASFPIVAVSGTIIEQSDRLEEIGADYYVAKGPMEKMTQNVEELMAKIEKKSASSSSGKTVFGLDMMPRQEIEELMKTVDFYRGICQDIGIGITVLDRDARIIFNNPLALEIVNRPDHEIMNQQITEIFPETERPKLVRAFKKLLHHSDVTKIPFFATMHSQEIRIIVSPLRIDGKIAAWILAMEGTGKWAEQA